MDFVGYVQEVKDAFILVEACKLGLVNMVKSRPIQPDAFQIVNGTTIVFDIESSGMKRWTDGRKWSPSKLIHGFFIYQQIASLPRNLKKLVHNSSKAPRDNEPVLNKKVISVCDSEGRWFHVVNYYFQYLNDIIESGTKILLRPSKFSILNTIQVQASIENYRYIKCFRTRSKQCRQLVGITSSTRPFLSLDPAGNQVTSPKSVSTSLFTSVSAIANLACHSEPSPHFQQLPPISFILDQVSIQSQNLPPFHHDYTDMSLIKRENEDSKQLKSITKFFN